MNIESTGKQRQYLILCSCHGIAQSVKRLTAVWKTGVSGPNDIFLFSSSSFHPDHLWGHPLRTGGFPEEVVKSPEREAEHTFHLD